MRVLASARSDGARAALNGLSAQRMWCLYATHMTMILLPLIAFAVSGALATRPLVIWHGMGSSLHLFYRTLQLTTT